MQEVNIKLPRCRLFSFLPSSLIDVYCSHPTRDINVMLKYVFTPYKMSEFDFDPSKNFFTFQS